ncbi:unnamed protein product [Pylaiella littoralis]
MPTAPNEKGIVDAMKSMRAIVDKNKVGKKQILGTATGFPLPPVDFVGSAQAADPKPKPKPKPEPKPKTNLKSRPEPKTKTKTKPTKRSPPPIPTPTPPMITPDTNGQLFGTLLNSVKTRPVGSLDSAKDNATTGVKATAVKKNVKKNTKGRGLPSPSSSYTSFSPSPSPSSNSSITSRDTVCSSSVTGTSDSTRSTQSSQECSSVQTDRLVREKKKRRGELLHEKVEMLTRIANLSKNGFTATKKWDVKDDIDEIRYECYRMQRESNSKKSIKIMRRVLVTITTLVETGNAYFNPFNLRLGGFSESMMLNLDDYDDCFEQIHHKYSGRSSVGPEMQIMFTFMSAAIFHHAGNAIGRQSGQSGQQRDEHGESKGSGASPMSSVLSMMGMLNGRSSASDNPSRSAPPARATDPLPGEHESRTKRKTMRGPGSSSIPSSIFDSQSTMPSMTLPHS